VRVQAYRPKDCIGLSNQVSAIIIIIIINNTSNNTDMCVLVEIWMTKERNVLVHSTSVLK
jgi:hypothetical protein